MRSILYWHSYTYALLVRLMFKKYYTDRYKAIKNVIDNNSSVVDVCCGDSKLYAFLKCKNINYLGLDFNQTFIKFSNKRGINVRLFDIYKDEIPVSDFVVIQGSMYQFIPNHNKILKKLYEAADKYLIITEPIRNYAQSQNNFISLIGRLLNNPGDSMKVHRFTLQTFKEALQPFKGNIVSENIINGDIEYMVVIKK